MNWWNPTDDEREMIRDVGTLLVNDIKENLRKRRISNVKIKLVGSTALDTFIAHDHDFDVFVVAGDEGTCKRVRKMFRKEYPRGNEKGGQLLAWDALYTPSRYPDHEFEVDQICITPEHDRFATVRHVDIYGALPSEQRQEMRKMKALLKSHGIYGAERGGFSSIGISESIRHFGSIDAFCDDFQLHDIFPDLEDPAQEGRDVFGSIKAQNPMWIKNVKTKLHNACTVGILDHPYGREDFVRDNKKRRILDVSCPSKDKITNFSATMHACTKSINEIGEQKITDPYCDIFIDKDTCSIAFGFSSRGRKNGPPNNKGMETSISAFKKANPDAMLDPSDNRWYAPLPIAKERMEIDVIASIMGELKKFNKTRKVSLKSRMASLNF